MMGLLGLLGLEGWGLFRKCIHYIREHQCFAFLSLLQVLVLAIVVSLVRCSLFSSLSLCSCACVLSSGAAPVRFWPRRAAGYWAALDEDRRHTPFFACSLVRLFVVALT